MVKVTIKEDNGRTSDLEGAFTFGAVCTRRDEETVAANLFLIGSINEDNIPDLVASAACSTIIQAVEGKKVSDILCSLIELETCVKAEIDTYFDEHSDALPEYISGGRKRKAYGPISPDDVDL